MSSRIVMAHLVGTKLVIKGGSGRKLVYDFTESPMLMSMVMILFYISLEYVQILDSITTN